MTQDTLIIAVIFGLMILIAGVYWAWIYAASKKPQLPGHCRCGYDLRGTESGVCPECGRDAKKKL